MCVCVCVCVLKRKSRPTKGGYDHAFATFKNPAVVQAPYIYKLEALRRQQISERKKIFLFHLKQNGRYTCHQEADLPLPWSLALLPAERSLPFLVVHQEMLPVMHGRKIMLKGAHNKYNALLHSRVHSICRSEPLPF